MMLFKKLFPLLCSASLLSAVACGRHGENSSAAANRLPTAVVRLAPVQDIRQTVREEVVGTVRAKMRATLEAKLSGRIQEVPVHLGQAVKKGDLIARLDAAETKARLDQAQASLEQASRDWNRISALFRKEAATRTEYDRAEAQQHLAQAAVAEAAAMMRYMEVLAPFDAVVSRKWAELGDFASPGKALVDVEDASSLELEADVPESVAACVQIGAALPVRLDGLSRDLEGQVAEMAPNADPASRTVRVKVSLAPTPGLIPGRFARLLVPIGESQTVNVPAAALVQRGQLEMVFVVTNNQAQLHLVKSGKRAGDQVAILSGLEAGEVVVAEGAGVLSDGQPVEVR
jgi:RND family efflux transporter MFP subunit